MYVLVLFILLTVLHYIVLSIYSAIAASVLINLLLLLQLEKYLSDELLFVGTLGTLGHRVREYAFGFCGSIADRGQYFVG